MGEGAPANLPATQLRTDGCSASRTTTNDYRGGDWVTISLETAKPTPWSAGAATLEYSPSKNVLWRGAEFLKVSSGLASQLEQRESLADGPDTGSFAWWALLGGIAGSALIAPTVLLIRRRAADKGFV
jgi:hypothetical protein